MKSIRILGKSIPLVVMVLVLVGLASGALLTYYGKIQQTVTVKQAVTLNGETCSGNVCTEDLESMYTGDILVSKVYTLTNLADTPRGVELVTSYNPGIASGEIITTYLKEIRYTESFSKDIDGSTAPLEVTVTDDGDWVIWTFDFPVEGWTGGGNLNVGLIIALDGEGNGPAFQIHNNDGATGLYPVGTWMYGSWGPTINDGWFGWSNHDLDVPIENFDWIEATGNRNVPHEGGIFQIKIKKSKLGESFHWAASPTVGSGFSGVYDVTMQIPTAFGWSTPIVTSTNYEYVKLMEEITTPFTLSGEDTLSFVVKNEFMTTGFEGTITTEVQPVA